MSGIYGLVRLDGGPVDSRDAALLGLGDPGEASAIATGIDARIASALHRIDGGGALTLLVGHIDDAEALAHPRPLCHRAPWQG